MTENVIFKLDSEFRFEEEQQCAFESAKEIMQCVLNVWLIQKGDIEIHVTVQGQCATLSMCEKQGKKSVLLDFWTEIFSNAGEYFAYTVIGIGQTQLCVCFCALLDTGQTVDCELCSDRYRTDTVDFHLCSNRYRAHTVALELCCDRHRADTDAFLLLHADRH